MLPRHSEDEGKQKDLGLPLKSLFFFLPCLPLCCVAATKKKKIQRMKARAAEDTHTPARCKTHTANKTRGVVESLLCRKGQAGKRPPAPVNGTKVYRACPTQGTPSSPIIGHGTTPDPLRNASNPVRAHLPVLVHLSIYRVPLQTIYPVWSNWVWGIEFRYRPSAGPGPPSYGIDIGYKLCTRPGPPTKGVKSGQEIIYRTCCT